MLTSMLPICGWHVLLAYAKYFFNKSCGIVSIAASFTIPRLLLEGVPKRNKDITKRKRKEEKK